jgi:hypothetical protein
MRIINELYPCHDCQDFVWKEADREPSQPEPDLQQLSGI